MERAKQLLAIIITCPQPARNQKRVPDVVTPQDTPYYILGQTQPAQRQRLATDAALRREVPYHILGQTNSTLGKNFPVGNIRNAQDAGQYLTRRLAMIGRTQPAQRQRPAIGAWQRKATHLGMTTICPILQS